jgi:hypothetical protein
MAKQAIEVAVVRLPDWLDEEVRSIALKTGMTVSELHRAALEHFLMTRDRKDEQHS